MSLRKRSSLYPPQHYQQNLHTSRPATAINNNRISFSRTSRRLLASVIITIVLVLVVYHYYNFLREYIPRITTTTTTTTTATSISTKHHRCTKHDEDDVSNESINIGLPIPSVKGERLFRVNVGTCNVIFAPDLRCPDSVIKRISLLTQFEHVPCTNLSVQLSATTPYLTLRTFGIKSRRDKSLPFYAEGAVIPYDISPYIALSTPDDRPYTWKSNIPPSSYCKPGKCRRLIRAMLLAYLCGCGALHSDSLWMSNNITNNNSNHYDDNVLLAFPHLCNSISNNLIAYDLLVQYLKVSCEIPRQFLNTLSSLQSDSRLGERASQLLMLLRNKSSFSRWWSSSPRNSHLCHNNVRTYEHGLEQWRKSNIPQWLQQLTDAKLIANSQLHHGAPR